MRALQEEGSLVTTGAALGMEVKTEEHTTFDESLVPLRLPAALVT